MMGLGAWRIDGSGKMTLELLGSYGFELRKWSYDMKFIRANGGAFASLYRLEATCDPFADSDLNIVCVGSLQDLLA
jgi:hypothetical protein